MGRLLLVLGYKWPCQLTYARTARNTGRILEEAPGVTEIQLLLIRRKENISICLDWEKEFMSPYSSASICWYVDNTSGHPDIREVASNRNQINHRSQHVICLIMNNTSHFLSTQKSTLWTSRWRCYGMAPSSTVADAEHLHSTLKKWHNTSCFLGKRFKLNKCHQTKYTYLLMFWTYLIQPLSSNQIHTCRPGSDAI